ncbi:MAG: flagellar basal body protein [Pseudomonadota bacterium]
MSTSALAAGLSGVKANQQALAVEAHNVANLSTENFRAQEANFQEAGPAGSGVTLSAEGLSLSRSENGTDFAKSITNQMTYKAGFEMSLKVIEADNERMGMLINIKA